MALRALFVEDVPADAALAVFELKRAGLDCEVRRVETEEALIREIEAFRPDIILSDFSLPRFSGLAALEMARQHTPQTPFIFVSGTIGEYTAIESLKRGAVDYILKGHLARLPSAVRRALHEAKERAARQRAEEALRLRESAVAASIDPIIITSQTGSGNPILYVNPAFERLTGYSSDEVIGRDCSFLQGEDRAQPAIQEIRAAIRDQRDGHALLRNYRKDGSLYWNDLHITPVRDPESGRVTHFVGVQHDVTEAKHYQDELEHQANHDALTGLPNRNLLNDRLEQAVIQARRRQTTLTVALLDLDQFKQINDSLGHGSGDRVLKIVAERLAACVREGDTVARLGGDEFVVVLSGQDSDEGAIQVIERIVRSIGEPVITDGRELVVTCSIGVASYPSHGADAETLLRNADSAMYGVKHQARDGVQFYSTEMNARIGDRLALTSALRRALERKEFELHYQPQIDLTTGRIFGAEALIRWRQPSLGIVYPEAFIPAAEESGLIEAIGTWTLQTACRQNQRWQEAGLPPVTVAVNLSARQFRRRGVVASVAQILRESRLKPAWLELELTESMMMHSVEEVIETLEELKALGVQVTVDDFGVGYSSLNYLKRFPVDRLKIDRSFVQDIGSDPDDAAIAQAIVALGRSLQMHVVAEGVESSFQLACLRDVGCDEAQGYYFSRPLPAAQFELLLARGAGFGAGAVAS